MKVGDLVKHTRPEVGQLLRGQRSGIVIEQGVFVGRRDIKILWDDGKIFTADSKKFEVLSEL